MSAVSPLNFAPPTILSYLASSISQEVLNDLTSRVSHLFQKQAKHYAIIGTGLSAIATAYTAISSSTSQWVFYAAGCILCLGTAYYQGHLEHSLSFTQKELDKTKNSLQLAETSLSDRDLLLSDLSKTQRKLKESSDFLITAGVNEKKLINELTTISKKQAELSDTVVELTTIVNFFRNLKDSYPDPEIFLSHLSSIEKVTRFTQLHLGQSNTETAAKLQELKTFIETLSKQDMDQMALLLKINEGVNTANQSLEKLKTGLS
jgi:hypothetical protein